MPNPIVAPDDFRTHLHGTGYSDSMVEKPKEFAPGINEILKRLGPAIPNVKEEHPAIANMVEKVVDNYEEKGNDTSVIDSVLRLVGIDRTPAPKEIPFRDKLHAAQNIEGQLLASKEASNKMVLLKYAEGMKYYLDKQDLDGSAIVEELFDGSIIV